jgi:hypothetical protein
MALGMLGACGGASFSAGDLFQDPDASVALDASIVDGAQSGDGAIDSTGDGAPSKDTGSDVREGGSTVDAPADVRDGGQPDVRDGGNADAPFDAPGDVILIDAARDSGGDVILAPDPGKIECGQDTCDTSTQFCCLGLVAPITRTCVPENNICLGPDQHCDEAADCPQGQVCCASGGVIGVSTFCQNACSVGQVQVCSTQQECKPGVACVAHDCSGRVVGTCGQVEGACR